jgi:hypothetical protein
LKTKAEVAELLERVFLGESLVSFESLSAGMYNEIQELRKAGQAEYVGGDQNAFGNFERLANMLDLDRKSILWVYCTKHLDGITSYLRGHKSQREDVRGRINDVIVYLILLRGMIDDEESIGKDQRVEK